ncbi:cysteine desulfurase / selenocysteine lyase [Alkalispirochaeta americana]|uniref:Cysteine desulfurase n=1 Tax=Alkalispirochaeta americana TaxID=159291 RepID=A0A1N6VXZ9_9SPIO|nr:SufS family cysteine desulfurase [Alkalispirochaeta americana]SIQ82753.1 cysteine desulfurase / selenocysteine lyase [Alkalispirochaeta americana]
MTSTLDIQSIREDFPALATTMRGKDLIYFDNGATSLKPRPVLEALQGYYGDYSANIHRGVYEMSERATAAYDNARETIRRFLGVSPEQGEVIFTRGTTESINLVAYSWAVKFLKPGDEILLTAMEHHSNIVPWQYVAQRTGAVLRYIPMTPEGAFTDEALCGALGPRVRLVAITAMSNVTGYMPSLEGLVARARHQGARVLVDGAQYACHHAVNVTALDCDFFAFSGHKMCGPTGIGVLYAKRELLEEMDPFHYGGDMIQEVTLEGSTWAHLPEKFEAGTPHIAGAVGMAAAAEYLLEIGLEEIAAHEGDLLRYVTEATERLSYLRPFGPAALERRGGIFSFALEGVHPHDVGSLLDQQGIAVRTGFHCAQPLMAHFGVVGTVRASFYLYNTREEIDRFVAALERLYGILG